MELPSPLREAIDRALDGVSLKDLTRAAGALSARYRAEIRDSRMHVSDHLSALAYLTTRLPATYAAARAAFVAVSSVRPDFAPRTLLDIGAGSGATLWAAADCWPSLEEATLIEASAAMRACGERFARELPLRRRQWLASDLRSGLPNLPVRDLVTIGYVLDEIAPRHRERLVARAWELTSDMLVIVEPGKPSGWQRMLHARDQLLAAGAHIAAPCPHANACPLAEPDWCHFSRRLARSRLHRRAKGAEVPWEDEKFIYLAVSRRPVASPAARVIAPPHAASGQVMLKLCEANGHALERRFTRREGAAYKAARRLDWGDPA